MNCGRSKATQMCHSQSIKTRLSAIYQGLGFSIEIRNKWRGGGTTSLWKEMVARCDKGRTGREWSRTAGVTCWPGIEPGKRIPLTLGWGCPNRLATLGFRPYWQTSPTEIHLLANCASSPQSRCPLHHWARAAMNGWVICVWLGLFQGYQPSGSNAQGSASLLSCVKSQTSISNLLRPVAQSQQYFAIWCFFLNSCFKLAQCREHLWPTAITTSAPKVHKSCNFKISWKTINKQTTSAPKALLTIKD